MASVGLIVGSLCGCQSGPTFDYVGEWRGLRDVQAVRDANPDVVQSLRSVQLKIDANGEFSLASDNVSKEGILVRTVNGAALEVKTLMGVRVEKQPEEIRRSLVRYELHPRADGKLEFLDPGKSEGPVLLERAAKPRG